jgi:hypothetical protein
MGLANGSIPTSDISVSSKNTPDETVDTIRMDNIKLWIPAHDDTLPWIEIRFPPSKNFQKYFVYFKKQFFIFRYC